MPTSQTCTKQQLQPFQAKLSSNHLNPSPTPILNRAVSPHLDSAQPNHTPTKSSSINPSIINHIKPKNSPTKTGIENPVANEDSRAIGIDIGLLDFVVTSDGFKYQNPRHLKKHERNLKRKQRKLSKKKDKTTNRQRKAKLAVARVHAKIARVREDFRHKLSRKIVNENQVIVVENLAVKNMVKNHCLAKSISDAGWEMFCTMLKYKAEADGKVYLEVGRFFPSSHLCSNTLLSLPKMDLSVHEFDCAHCGNRHDRDINANQYQE